jgi:hypothetical protein
MAQRIDYEVPTAGTILHQPTILPHPHPNPSPYIFLSKTNLGMYACHYWPSSLLLSLPKHAARDPTLAFIHDNLHSKIGKMYHLNITTPPHQYLHPSTP